MSEHTDVARSGLTGMLLPQLRALAGELGIRGTSGMRKGDLIAAIKENQAGKAAKSGKPARSEAEAEQTAIDVTAPAKGKAAAEVADKGAAEKAAGKGAAEKGADDRAAAKTAERKAAADADGTAGEATKDAAEVKDAAPNAQAAASTQAQAQPE
ncbi:Rho termination factor N-terminal domain-containing protein, partial [Nocardia farcinica]|uniref:Rho termination factor N-terminal domain-containing protein n=1 Tax=Nocardia farcinica TaxID=37329 RepID=UPI0024564FBD